MVEMARAGRGRRGGGDRRAAIARQERQRRAYTPEEIRTRLHERYAEADE